MKSNNEFYDRKWNEKIASQETPFFNALSFMDKQSLGGNSSFFQSFSSNMPFLQLFLSSFSGLGNPTYRADIQKQIKTRLGRGIENIQEIKESQYIEEGISAKLYNTKDRKYFLVTAQSQFMNTEKDYFLFKCNKKGTKVLSYQHLTPEFFTA